MVAAVGDSLTDYRSGGGKFLRYLEERSPKSRFDNYGRGGKMANQMRRKFRGDLFGSEADGGKHPSKPDYTHVIVFGGVNDLYSDLTAGRTPTKISRDLAKMYGWAKARDIEIVAITVAPWGGFREVLQRRGAARRRGGSMTGSASSAMTASSIHLVDAYRLLSCGDSERLCGELARPYRDGLHFGPKGHEKLGAALYASVFRDCE